MKKIISILFIVLLSNNLQAACGDKIGKYSAGVNYYKDDTSKTLKLVNLLFKKSYTSYVGKNPGHITGEFLELYNVKGHKYHHKGLDIRAKTPMAVYSPISGEVISTGADEDNSDHSREYGRVLVYNKDYDVTFNFQHLSAFNVSIGNKIHVGTLIGYSGEKGAKDAPHLHVGLRKGKIHEYAQLNFNDCDAFDPRIVLDYINVGQGTFDGAGSLISPNEFCFGCDRDTAKMHPHSNGSTVVFQWLYDRNSCEHIDLYADGGDLDDVIIRSKAWDAHEFGDNFRVNMTDGKEVSIRNTNEYNYVTLAMTTVNPISKSIKIQAECRDNSSTLHHGGRKSIKKDLVDVTHGYFWTGTASVITKAQYQDPLYAGFGVKKDWAITYNSHNSLTSFQWYAKEGKKIRISGIDKDKNEINFIDNVSISMKPWDADDSGWREVSCLDSLPCQFNAKRGKGYYIIKVKTKKGAIPDDGWLQAKEVN